MQTYKYTSRLNKVGTVEVQYLGVRVCLDNP